MKSKVTIYSYQIGKRKERVQKAVQLLESLRKDLANNPVILQAINMLKELRKDLDEA